jgi:hypothetical protein
MTGFSDPLYLNASAGQRDKWLARSARSGSRIIRINLSWAAVAGAGPPANPQNPSDPAYNFGAYDAAITAARAHGLRVLLGVSAAPWWAEGPDRPQNAAPGSWKPSPQAFGDFARAVGLRYSGDYGNLPRVGYFLAWHEPNLPAYLGPQYRGKHARSPAIYGRLLNAFFAGVKAVNPRARVVAGGTAPYGDAPGGERVRPLVFLRKLLCLKGRELHRDECQVKPRLDILAHHPIDTAGGPRGGAIHPDNVATADFDRIVKTLRAAERHHKVLPRGRRPAWATEMWWESKPPDRAEGVRLKKHARWIGTAVRMLRHDGASVVLNLRIRDAKYTRATRFAETAAGIFFHRGKRKPAYKAWRAASR